MGVSYSRSKLNLRIDPDVLRSFAFEPNHTVEFIYGMFDKHLWSHQALFMTYCIHAGSLQPEPAGSDDMVKFEDDAEPRIEMRTVLIELFVDQITGQKILSVRRMFFPRDGYNFRELILSRTSLRAVVEFAKVIVQQSGPYSFLFNNCRHFSRDLFEVLKKEGNLKLKMNDSELKEYIRRYPPTYGIRTREYVPLGSLLERFPLGPPTPIQFRAKMFAALADIHFEPMILSNLEMGDVVSIEMSDLPPFHHFALFLGTKAEILEILETQFPDSMVSGFLRWNVEEFHRLKTVLQNSSAELLHIDHNGAVVGLRDFQSQFLDHYPGKVPWRVTHLPGFNSPDQPTERRIYPIPKFPKNILIQAAFGALGLESYDAQTTCTCTVAKIYQIPVGLDPQIPLGNLGASIFNAYTQKNPDLDRSALFDRPLTTSPTPDEILIDF